MKNFRELRVWQKGLLIAEYSYKLVASFPKEEKFALSLQITRAAVSISSNIAEGSSRSSEKDYNRFLQIALGSAFELETQLLISETIGIGENQTRKALLIMLSEEQKMISALMGKLEKQGTKC